MKKIIYSVLAVMGLSLTSCADLDLNPPTEASVETWFKSEDEFDMACKDFYREAMWHLETRQNIGTTDRWTEDWMQRETGYDWMQGTLDGKTGWIGTAWLNTYKAITRANAVIASVARQRGTMGDAVLNRFEGEARMFRAIYYSYLIFHWGDVPYYEEYQTIESAYKLGRVDKKEILQKIYADFDKAIELLPDENPSPTVRACKATAMAFKCRTASWMLDYPTAKKAAEDCINSKKYALDSDYSRIFLPSTTSSPEWIFCFPRSVELGNTNSFKSFLPRTGHFDNVKGTAVAGPSMEALLAYTCTDGLMVDESPLYNAQKPWLNRDPRCAMTLVLPETNFFGVEFDPSKKKVMDYTTGKEVTNNDTRMVQQYAQYSGIMLRKGVDESWWANGMNCAMPNVVMRYADVLLMYAEAKIELGECDQDACDKLNQVRARAYGCKASETDKYPAIKVADQKTMRKAYRVERHMELMWENRHWFDLMRWRLAHILNNRPTIGFPLKKVMEDAVKRGDYFFPKGSKPKIDENGLIDMTPIIEMARQHNGGEAYYVHPVLMNPQQEKHDYLFPLPTEDVTLVFGVNNPGY